MSPRWSQVLRPSLIVLALALLAPTAGLADPPAGDRVAHGSALYRQELIMASLGSDGLEWESTRSREGFAARAWLRSKANSIEGGTSEVQLNIVSKRILGLPGE